MASSWRSLLKEKIHSVLFLNNGSWRSLLRRKYSVLSRDKEIKEQFIGRRQLTRDRSEQKGFSTKKRLEQKVPPCTEFNVCKNIRSSVEVLHCH